MWIFDYQQLKSKIIENEVNVHKWYDTIKKFFYNNNIKKESRSKLDKVFLSGIIFDNITDAST